jgi:hypothetical protein
MLVTDLKHRVSGESHRLLRIVLEVVVPPAKERCRAQLFVSRHSGVGYLANPLRFQPLDLLFDLRWV